MLTQAQFGALDGVPAELEWITNLTNPKTCRAYKNDVEEFVNFAGLRSPSEMRTVTRAMSLLGARTSRSADWRLPVSAASSRHCPVCSITCAARKLLEAPPADALKGLRDRAVLATLLYHGMRREELCRLRVRYIQDRQGVKAGEG